MEIRPCTKFQELQLLSYLHKKGLTFTHDVVVPEMASCGIKYRPDFLIRGSPNIIIEIDEDGHVNYDKERDATRTSTLFQYLNPLKMIRVYTKKDLSLQHNHCDKVYSLIQDIYVKDDIENISYLFYPILKQVTKKHINVTSTINPIPINKNPKKFVCTQCGYSTDVKQHFQNHQKRVTKCEKLMNDVNTHVCEFCRRQFSRKDNLRRHSKTCTIGNQPIILTNAQLGVLLKGLQIDEKIF